MFYPIVIGLKTYLPAFSGGMPSFFNVVLFKKLMKPSGRNLAGWLVANLLILSGSVRRATKKAVDRKNITVICFHKPSREEFESCIRWLQKYKFSFLSIQELDDLIHQDLPFPKGGVVLTIDDGWQSNEANVVEVADKYGVPVAIYISTQAVEEGTFWWSYFQEAKKRKIKAPSGKQLKKVPNEERLLRLDQIRQQITLPRGAMTVEQVRRIARSANITIGCHSHSHPILPNCTTDQVYSELSLSKQKLESWTGKEVASFAYPNGDFGLREMQLLADLRFRLAFSLQQRHLSPGRLGNKFSLPRFCFLEDASFAENVCRMMGIWQPYMRRFKQLFSKKVVQSPSPKSCDPAEGESQVSAETNKPVGSSGLVC
jgi:peptidoglycan/xylan/chitin deacetylase (PgdA/CDA1 family)